MTLERAREIIEQVFTSKPLKEIIPTSTERVYFFELIARNAELANSYARAQQVRAELMADEVVDIADKETDAAKARNRIMARQWHAGKLNPKYSERIDLNVNQTVDIGGALGEAMRRALPRRFQGKDVESEVVETIELKGNGTDDSESSGPNEDDIFS